MTTSNIMSTNNTDVAVDGPASNPPQWGRGMYKPYDHHPFYSSPSYTHVVLICGGTDWCVRPFLTVAESKPTCLLRLSLKPQASTRTKRPCWIHKSGNGRAIVSIPAAFGVSTSISILFNVDLQHHFPFRDRNPDLLEPHILRSLANVKITSVHTSCAGCHFVAIDIDGYAWLFGRNGFSCLGVSGEEYISENAPRMVKASDLGAPKGTKFVHAACGRNHTLLVGSDGSVWSAGVNNLGQVCGIPSLEKHFWTF